MSCAKGTQRVFGIDIETCLACAGTVWLTYKALAAQNDGRPQPLANPVRGYFRTKRLCILTGPRTETATPHNYGTRDLLCAICLAVR